jgi:eukaryotic-like serine/threonine-protein kinase
MAILPGTRLGVYEVVAQIGAGGMGEVYRARDTRLNRDVALKVLPEAFSRDSQRMGRFDREAKVLASLNHPNIAAIYGIEESGPIKALVMELVEGPTLADRIRNGAIPLDEALPIVRQVADAVEYAHDKNVIHRDLKPTNIKVKEDGTVKVLDFGLAKALSDDPTEGDMSNSPTLSMAATRAGVILGTAAYMAPEQAKGKVVDRRADVWAFGAVFYEMLTGQPAFPGDDITEVLAAVVKSEPALDTLPANIPSAIRTLVRRCLEKTLRRRLSHIAEARFTIEQVLAGDTGDVAGTVSATAPIRPVWRRLLPWSVAAVLAVALVAAVALWRPWRAAPVSPVVGRFTIALGPGEILAPANGGLAVSPDGRYIAYSATLASGTRQLFLRPMDRSDAIAIPGTENAGGLFFSPDSQWIAFTANQKLEKVPVSGGTPIVLCDHLVWNTGSWGSDGTIFFGEYDDKTGKIMRIQAAGGTPQVVSTMEIKPGELGPRWLEVLPKGQALLYATGGSSGAFSDDAAIIAQSLTTGQQKTLVQGGASPQYLSTGHLIYAQGGRLLAAPFDVSRLEVTGAAVPILEDVWQGSAGYSAYSLSTSGSAAYINGGEAGGTQPSKLSWVDSSGVARALIETAHRFSTPNISPDGRRVALTNANVTAAPDVWVAELARGTLTRLTFGKPGDQAAAPVWTPDGKRVIYSVSSGTGYKLMRRAADGSGAEEMLFSSNDVMYPMTCSPDGQLVVFVRNKGSGGLDLWVLELAGEHQARPLIESSFSTGQAQISPDGRWLAYVSGESGRWQVFIQPFPGLGGKWQISTTEGVEPRWSRDGRRLFYRTGNKMMVVEIDGQAGFAASSPRLLFEQPYARFPVLSAYDVAPDGQHFVMLKEEGAQLAEFELRVVLNWAEEVKRRLAPAQK